MPFVKGCIKADKSGKVKGSGFKKANLNVRTTPKRLKEFDIACKYKNLKKTAIINNAMDDFIKQVKKENAEIFNTSEEVFEDAEKVSEEVLER